MSEPPKYGLYLLLNYRPFKPLLNYQHGRFPEFLLGSKNNRNCQGFCRGKRKTLRSGGFLIFLYEFNKGFYMILYEIFLRVTFWF